PRGIVQGRREARRGGGTVTTDCREVDSRTHIPRNRPYQPSEGVGQSLQGQPRQRYPAHEPNFC
ncbi:hypothetical protein BGZ95_006529, partial [Linnemannia exigua]